MGKNIFTALPTFTRLLLSIQQRTYIDLFPAMTVVTRVRACTFGIQLLAFVYLYSRTCDAVL